MTDRRGFLKGLFGGLGASLAGGIFPGVGRAASGRRIVPPVLPSRPVGLVQLRASQSYSVGPDLCGRRVVRGRAWFRKGLEPDLVGLLRMFPVPAGYRRWSLHISTQPYSGNLVDFGFEDGEVIWPV